MTIRSIVGSQAIVIVPTRNSSVIGASSGSVSLGCSLRRRDVDAAGAAPQHLVEHLVQVLGQHRHLLLLAGHAGDAVPLPGLQEEGPLAGLTDGAGHEPVRGVVAVNQDRHASA